METLCNELIFLMSLCHLELSSPFFLIYFHSGHFPFLAIVWFRNCDARQVPKMLSGVFPFQPQTWSRDTIKRPKWKKLNQKKKKNQSLASVQTWRRYRETTWLKQRFPRWKEFSRKGGTSLGMNILLIDRDTHMYSLTVVSIGNASSAKSRLNMKRWTKPKNRVEIHLRPSSASKLTEHSTDP